MDKVLRLKVNSQPELHTFYNGKPELIREALLLYMRAKQNFLKDYEESV